MITRLEMCYLEIKTIITVRCLCRINDMVLIYHFLLSRVVLSVYILLSYFIRFVLSHFKANNKLSMCCFKTRKNLLINL